MSDPEGKIEVVQAWINELRQHRTTDLAAFNLTEGILDEVVDLIQQVATNLSSESGQLGTYEDLERQVQEQTAALTRATTALKSQITERETAARKLRKAYNDLETHLQEHIEYQSRLNQRLQEQINEQKRTQVLEHEERALTEALRDTLATMSSTLDLDKILDHILDTVKRITPYDGANVLFVESDLVRMVRQRGYIEKGLDKDWLNQRIPITRLMALQQLINVGKPVAIADTIASPTWVGFPGLDWVRSNVTAPIRSNGKILGFLSLDSATTGFFTQAHADRLQSFADQAAIAIQNARLLDRAKRAAVTAERNRLSNELHDTISQTLWSMRLITERLPVIWEVDQEEGRRSLATLHQLARSALEEMRSLLLELRPSALTGEKLGDLILQAAAIITNRTGLNISVQIEEQKPVPPDVHFALYRVVQEALNNIVLHTSASQVAVYFSSKSGHIDLTIQDNGPGFDPADIGPGHLGLSIMKDRVQNIGGALEIISRKGEGTMVKVGWTAPTNETIVQ
ncbi:MAG TPA: GAF domain-containing sensor histidine kinase [Phototrophicaceae bacterium]|jgi:signal transduction histidine kinase|nr:GAF domain-containing sensor histidine kinase [Phototrophicaceae bacterium]